MLVNITSGAGADRVRGMGCVLRFEGGSRTPDGRCCRRGERRGSEGLFVGARDRGHGHAGEGPGRAGGIVSGGREILEAKRDGAFNTASWVADGVLELAFGELDIESGGVVRVPDEWERNSP